MHTRNESVTMSNAKTAIMENLKLISDDVKDEVEVLNRLYMLIRLEHSKERCKTSGTVSDDEVDEYFFMKREKYRDSL